MKQYVRRWQHVETSQWTLKQNLVKYNNFVREKQGKVADGVSFILMEKQKQAKVSISTLQLTKHCLSSNTLSYIAAEQ